MSTRSIRRGRDTNAIANNRAFVDRRLLPLSLVSPWAFRPYQRPKSEVLRLYEDRRAWHPEGQAAPARSFSQTRHRLTVVDRPLGRRQDGRVFRFSPLQTKATIAFARPNRVLVCVRRQQRKEVLHSMGKTGRLGQRSPRRNWTSEISCRG